MNTTKLERSKDHIYVTDYNYVVKLRNKQKAKETTTVESFESLYLKS